MSTPASTPSSPASSAGTCPRCHQPIPAGAAHGLCPACMLAAGFFTQAAPDASPASDTPPPSPAELAPEFPQFEIIELLGRGGMGAVYKARQRHLDRLVALKLLRPGLDADPSFAERFTREARALAQLNHPGIVTLHEFGRTPGGLYFIVMEFVDGMNLRQLLAAGRLAPREALAIVPPLCDALQYAHDRGLVHRDIKPENILIDRLGRVKIADFGLARLVAEAEDEPSGRSPGENDPAITLAGQIMGTPRYMAPEQREHPAAVDHRADIYALGVVLYQMLTGELPDEKQLQPPSRRVLLDVRLDEIVLRALEKNPALRYAAASELKTGIETLASSDPTPPENAGAQPIPPATGETAARPHTSASPGPACADVFEFEYKSRRTLFGLPLLHIANGRDPVTGRLRVAHGIVAIGGIARGVFAFGGVALGVFSFGGLSLGLLAYGGVAAGLLSVGGLGLGLLACFAGLALAPVALGGLAVGWYAFGGVGFGRFVVSATRQDPPARDFFESWAQALLIHSPWWNILLLAGCMLVCCGLPWWVRRRLGGGAVSPEPAAPSLFAPWLGFALLYLVHLLLLALTADDLPARVASHFNGDGRADGWMPRGEYLLFSAGFPLALGLFLALIARALRVLPASLINLPHRDHWLAPENKAATVTLLGRWMAGPACLLVVFFAQLGLLIVHANASTPQRLAGGPMMGITIGFLAALMLWLVGLVLRFAEPKAPSAKLRRQHGVLFAAALLALALPAAPLIDEWHDLPGKLRRRHAEPVPEAAVTPPLAPDFAARLPGGGYLELLGVADQPSASAAWWRPDGAPLPPVDWLADYPSSWPIANTQGPAYANGRQFVFHADGPGQPPRILDIRFFGADGTPAAFAASLVVKQADGRENERWAGHLMPVRSGETAARIRVLVADGPLQKLPDAGMKFRGPRHSFQARIGDRGFLIGEIGERDGRASIPLSAELGGEVEWRLLALDSNGRWHTSRIVEGRSLGDLLQETLVFDELRPADIVEIALWTRPAHWVEFTDVTLATGQARTPTIQVESAPPAPGPDTPESAGIVPPEVPASPSDPAGPSLSATVQMRLLDLTLELAAARVRYGPRHPTLIALETEFSALEKQMPAWRDAIPPGFVAGKRILLTAARERLSQRYRPEYPAMVENRQKLDALNAFLSPSALPAPEPAPAGATMPATPLQAEVGFHDLPPGFVFDPATFDPDAVLTPGASLRTPPPVTVLGGTACELSVAPDHAATPPASASPLPPGITMRLLPVLSWSSAPFAARYTISFAARVTISGPDPVNPALVARRELVIERDAAHLDTPLILDLGLDGRGRRTVAVLRFTLPPPPDPVVSLVSTTVAFLALPDGTPFDPLAADAATRASAPAVAKLDGVGMMGSSGTEMNLSSGLGVREKAPDSDLGQTPPGVQAVVRPTLDGRRVRFSARLTITRPSPDSPQRMLSREVAAEGETTLGTPAFLDLGPDDAGRRLVARLDFASGDTDTLMRYPPRGTPMPDIKLFSVADGRPVRLRDFVGQPIVLLFWHSLASPSHEPLAALQGLFVQHPEWRGRVQLITLSHDATREAAAAFLARNDQGATVDLLVTPDTWKPEPARVFRASATPTCYLIDADGRLVRAGHHGELDLSDLLPGLLAAPPTSPSANATASAAQAVSSSGRTP